MRHVSCSIEGPVATLRFERGKVNALTEEVIGELASRLAALAEDDAVRAIVLTGRGAFFSFGFDVPHFVDHSPQRFTEFLEGFTACYTRLFELPKPTIAALNGHAVAGGCMLATACDRRLMATGGSKIGLNELRFGAAVFAGAAAMLETCVGARNAAEVLYSGRLFTADEAAALGLVDRAIPGEELQEAARDEAGDLAGADPAAFAAIKRLLRAPVAERMRRDEASSIRAFVEIWYSASTRRQLAEIKIR